MYDWAIAAFPVIVTTFVFAEYFTGQIAANSVVGTHQWGNAMALAGLVVAIASPLLGVFVDKCGQRKMWLGACTLVIIMSSALLWYAYPFTNYVEYTLTCVVFGTIALNISMVFYNALLPELVPPQYVGRLSGWGWGLGYFGGLVILIIALYGFIGTNLSWLNHDTYAQVRICGPLVAFWVLLFALPLVVLVPDKQSSHESTIQAIRHLKKNFTKTLQVIWRDKMLVKFLLAQMIYMDGLNTLFAFAGIYAAGTFHMSLREVLIFGIFMNVFAGIGAMIFAWMDDFMGTKFTVILSLLLLTLFGWGAVLVENKMVFLILGCSISVFVGPVQSASRSLMTHLISKEQATTMFGFYILSGKITTFIGPWVLGAVTFYFKSQRVGMASILVFFMVGALLLWFVRVPIHVE